jgi:hypothetical protein
MASSGRSVTVPLSDQRRCASHTAVLASAADNPVGWHSIFLFSLVAGWFPSCSAFLAPTR